jgi:hypothetical protein
MWARSRKGPWNLNRHITGIQYVVAKLFSSQWHGGQENDAAAQSADAGRLRDVVARCNALGSERPRVVFGTRNLEQDLGRLLRSGNVEQHRDVLERPLASAALAGTGKDPPSVALLCLCILWNAAFSM